MNRGIYSRTTLNFTFLMTMWIRNKVAEIVIVSSLAVSPIYLLFTYATISYCFTQIVYEWSRNIDIHNKSMGLCTKLSIHVS